MAKSLYLALNSSKKCLLNSPRIAGCLALGLWLCVVPSWGWGRLGHQVVAMVADHHLSVEARQQVKRLLGKDSMAKVSTWPDEIRGRKDAVTRKTFPWHFATIADHYRLPKQAGRGDLLSAIESLEQVLHDDSQPAAKRRLALVFLIHLVADAHQPLHVGNGVDYGANRCFVHWLDSPKRVSLHRVWDTLLPKQIAQQQHVRAKGLADLIDHPSDAQVVEWQHGSVLLWLEASHGLHAEVYPGGAVDPRRRAYCQVPLHSHHLPHLTRRYVEQHQQLVEQQLLIAGVRLAGVLNAIL